MNVVELNQYNAVDVANLMHELKPEWWSTYEEAYGQLTDIEESISTIGWVLMDKEVPVGWTLFRDLKCYMSLELECSGFNDNGVFKLEHKLNDLFDEAESYAKSKGYTTLRTGMSSVDFNINGKKIEDISEAMNSLSSERIDYHWLLEYGFKVMGIQPNAYGNNMHLIMFVKELK